MTDSHVGSLLIGILLLTLAGICWSGVWRWWVEAPFYFGRGMMIALVPGLGIVAVGFGISGALPTGPAAAILLPSFLAVFVGFVIFLTDPEWYGPRFYRRFNRAFAHGQQARWTWMAEDPRHPDESSIEATQRHSTSGRPQPPSRSVRLLSETSGRIGEIAGRPSILVFYPQAPLFAVGGSVERPPLNEVIAAESLQHARKLSPGVGLDGTVRRSGPRSYLFPRVRIDTTEGSWLFESRKAKHVAYEIHYRYLDPSRDMYGMPLGEDTPTEYKKGAVSSGRPGTSRSNTRSSTSYPTE